MLKKVSLDKKNVQNVHTDTKLTLKNFFVHAVKNFLQKQKTSVKSR